MHLKKQNTTPPAADTKPTSLDQIYKKLATQYMFTYVQELKKEKQRGLEGEISSPSIINPKKENDETK